MIRSVELLLVGLLFIPISSVFGMNTFRCPSAAAARSCEGCEIRKNTQYKFDINVSRSLVSVTVMRDGKVKGTARFKDCLIVSKSNWECVDEWSTELPNIAIFSRTEWSALNGVYVHRHLYMSSNSPREIEIHACVK